MSFSIFAVILLISTVLNLVSAGPFIAFLARYGFYKRRKADPKLKKTWNERYYKFLERAMETPSSYGLLLIPNVIMISIVGVFGWGQFSLSEELLKTMWFSLLFLILGGIDDCSQYFLYGRMKRWGIRGRYKLAIEVILSLTFFYLLMNFSFMWAMGLAFLLSFFINSYNITDGLDGLVGGISVMVLATLILFECMTFRSSGVLAIYAVILGFFAVFLSKNKSPAQVFLGDAGSYPLGFLIGVLAMRYYGLAVGILFIPVLLEGISSFIQIISLGVFKRRVFLIAPLHLHLLNTGMSKKQVVRWGWGMQAVVCVVAAFVYMFLRG